MDEAERFEGAPEYDPRNGALGPDFRQAPGPVRHVREPREWGDYLTKVALELENLEAAQAVLAKDRHYTGRHLKRRSA